MLIGSFLSALLCGVGVPTVVVNDTTVPPGPVSPWMAVRGGAAAAIVAAESDRPADRRPTIGGS